MRCRTALLLTLVFGLIIAMSGITGCIGDTHDYSGLRQGDIARPEFEYPLDFSYWSSTLGLDKLIPPEGWQALDAAGVTSIRQSNVIAFERGGQIYIEGTYKLPADKTSLIRPLLEVTPQQGKLLGHLNNEGIMISFYFSGVEGFLKAIGSIITDPAAVDLIFQGNETQAAQVKLGFTTARSQIEGMFLDLFKDEYMIVFYPKPGFSLTKGEMPMEVVLIAPSASGREVAPDIIDLLKSFGSMLGAFANEPGIAEKLEPTMGEIAGHESYLWDFAEGHSLAMVDYDGYLFMSDTAGIEKILAAFDTKESKYEAIEPANMYFYIDYDLYFSQYMFPMLEAMDKEGVLKDIESQSPEMKAQMEESLSLTREMLDSLEGVGSYGWADCSFRLTGDGLRISERMMTEMAEVGLQFKDQGMELLKKMMANLQQGLPLNQVGEEASEGENEAEDAPAPAGGGN